MKLLTAFRNQVDAVGDIQRVWFTSFVVNVEFIETYLLPVILGMDTPKIRMDYEGMQQVLSERGIDFHVFCDKRYIEPDQNKRTALPIHGVTPELLPPNGPVSFSKDSLFHPKVIYIQGDKGAVLGTGSANLTVDGWGRNQEVFSFTRVVGTQLAESVKSFFEPIFVSVREPFPEDFPVLGEGAEQGETFCHSLAGPPFLDRLFENRPNELAVWSPYFSTDLGKYVQLLQSFIDKPNLKVQLVPDRVENQYFRTEWSEGVASLHQSGVLAFYQSPIERDYRSSMTHAKLWKTTDRLAIGSWNFTQPGSNLALEGRASSSNVEAGFIYSDASPLACYVGKELPFAEGLFASPEQMEQESLRVPELPPFDLKVVFDWQMERYFISGAWIGKGAPEEGLQLELPDLPHRVELKWEFGTDGQSFILRDLVLPVSATKELLKAHSFEVLRGLETLARGLIIERRSVYRRAQQYENLRGLLDALVLTSGNPPADDVGYRVREDEGGETLVDGLREEGETFVAGQEGQSTDISYFRLFSACHHYAELIEHCRDQKELEYWAFIRPGCLQELVEKTQHRIGITDSPTLFNWFLSQEVNQLCEVAYTRWKSLSLNESRETSERWRALKTDQLALPSTLSKKYQAWLAKEYQRRSGDKEKV
ncbi:hypothetical protein [Marinobacter sp. DY40_1A1]|uniref:hypothetical protein n=1 Tax=Marinobacter sp. DY40_1A1 TaxID=2583229 RepID=UPI00190532A0|nr:hypothetical protein [Marinobacter sp. DY40_1A1]MBK1885625.1 hypothetical protein [Marinobacter sp. DY40_1A1]